MMFIQNALTSFTNFLADKFCKGSTRKLIAGWWYTILGISLFLMLMTFYIVPTRQTAEAFTSCWSAIAIVCLCIGGTMVMRKFHNSFATGLFLGGVIGGAQFFFLLFLLYSSFAIERGHMGVNNFEDIFQAIVCFVQSILLGSFAFMLGAHRSSLVDRNSNLIDDDNTEDDDTTTYNPPMME